MHVYIHYIEAENQFHEEKWSNFAMSSHIDPIVTETMSDNYYISSVCWAFVFYSFFLLPSLSLHSTPTPGPHCGGGDGPHSASALPPPGPTAGGPGPGGPETPEWAGLHSGPGKSTAFRLRSRDTGNEESLG